MKPTQVELAVDLAAAWNIPIADVTQQLRDAKVKREAHGDGDSNQLWKRGIFADFVKSQAECLCLPATVTVMLLDQEVDFYIFFFFGSIFPSRCTKLLRRRPRWKTWRRCCLRMPLALIWRGDLRPIRSKMKPFVASAENYLENSICHDIFMGLLAPICGKLWTRSSVWIHSLIPRDAASRRWLPWFVDIWNF